MGPLGPPEPLAPRHDISQFSSGVPTLDAWLRGKARMNEARGGARTYVTCDGDRVAGFYSLAASSVERRRLSSRVGRNMPDPVPVILLGQLAVDTAWRGRGLGSDLLIDAVGRALAAAAVVGARAVAVQAIDDRARAFSSGSDSVRSRSASRSCQCCACPRSPGYWSPELPGRSEAACAQGPAPGDTTGPPARCRWNASASRMPPFRSQRVTAGATTDCFQSM